MVIPNCINVALFFPANVNSISFPRAKIDVLVKDTKRGRNSSSKELGIVPEFRF